MKKCVNCGAEMDDRERYCPQCGVILEDVYGIPETNSELQQEKYPMKWHRFLMVVMILGGVFTVINGINALLGSEYMGQGFTAEQVYYRFPGLKTADMLYGLAMIALGVFQFVVRSHLNQFRSDGPGMLKAWYIASLIINLIYILMASSALKVNAFDSSTIGTLGGSVFFLIVNSIYYSRRSELFVN